MRVKLTAKHPRPATPARSPVRSGSAAGRKPVRAETPAGERPARPAGDKPAGNERRPFKARDESAGPRGPRPSFSERGDRGPRPSFGDRNDRGPRPSQGDRPAPRGDRPASDERRPFKPRDDAAGPRGPRPSFSERGDRGPRPSFGDRNDRGPRPPQGDRNDRKPARAKPAKPSSAADTSTPSRPAIARAGDEGLVRLSKVMSELGLCSRREADEWIEKGWVLVDGETIDTLGTRIRPDQNIEILPAARSEQARLVTILINKPVGYVSGQAEDGYQPAVTLITPANHWADDQSGIRFAPNHLRTLAPAGRLDIDSTGLLVLTQDGRIAKTLIGGHSDVDKEYLVRVKFGERETDIDQHFPAESLALLRHGLELDDVPLKTAQVSWQNGEQLRFVLREGKKRQIRRMCELVGLEVVGLKRIRMGHVTLGALPPGQWRYLSADEAF